MSDAYPAVHPDRRGRASITTIGMTRIAVATTTNAGVEAGSHAPYGPAFRYGATNHPSGMVGPPRPDAASPIKQE